MAQCNQCGLKAFNVRTVTVIVPASGAKPGASVLALCPKCVGLNPAVAAVVQLADARRRASGYAGS